MKFKTSKVQNFLSFFSIGFGFCFASTFLSTNSHPFEHLILFLDAAKKQLGSYLLADLALIRAFSAAEHSWCSQTPEKSQPATFHYTLGKK